MLLFFTIKASSQTVDFSGKKINVSDLCNSLGFSDSNEAKKYLDEICTAAGIKSNFIMVQCNSINTCLAVEKDGDPYILYDNSFLNKLKPSVAYGFTEKSINNNSNNKDWASLTILAHEIGHHINQHFSKTIRSVSSLIDLELQADEYAGHIISRLGGSLQQGEKVYYSDVVSVNASLSHPSRSDRIKAFQEGYNKENAKNSIQGSASTMNYNSLIVGNWIDEKTNVVTSFYNDGSFSMSAKEQFDEGKWKLENNNLKIYNRSSETVLGNFILIDLNTYSLTLKENSTNSINILKRNNVTALANSNDYFRKNWQKFIYVDKASYSARKIGGISDVVIPIINKSEYTIDLVRVKIEYIKDQDFASGGVFKTEYLEFKNIKPKSKLTMRAPNSDRGTSIKIYITKVNSGVLTF